MTYKRKESLPTSQNIETQYWDHKETFEIDDARIRAKSHGNTSKKQK